MVCHFVRYRGSAADPSRSSPTIVTYASILRGFPGIKSLVLHTPAKVRDPCPVRPGGTALLAQMIFDNEAALNTALKSDSRQRARDDSPASERSTVRSRTKRLRAR
jgi:hypothetical protein